MNRIDEYKDKINWDIWEDIMTYNWGVHVPKGQNKSAPEESCTNSSQRANNVHSIKKA